MKIVNLNQGSDQWKVWRSGEFRDGKRIGGGLGGSDIAAILGLSPYPDATRESVLADKVHGVEREVNFAMRRGTRLEPHARYAYEQRRRCSAPPVCAEMDGCPWARVSLDGLCRDRRAEVYHAAGGSYAPPGAWVLELKCPSWEVHSAALEGIVPDVFAVQIQWQLLMCGLERCDFASFNPGERFTPLSWPLLPTWQERCKAWLAKPKCDRGGRPELLDLWLEQPPAERPEQPEEWLAVTEVRADGKRQADILREAGSFWYEVEEARTVLAPRPNVEAEFA